MPPAVIPGVAPPAAVTMPTWSEPARFEEAGLRGWIGDRLRAVPSRADRSRSLMGERGGRLDRLDAWFLVVLILATFGLRTFRLEEPYQMHFDEVYHARTATEFLQDWRYGESHPIYEWTHPHLAKYAMAGGLVLWGGDRVQATSQLGDPIRAVAIEHRRDEPGSARAGERLHIATGDIVRTEDLRTRQTIGRITAPGVGALAIDPTEPRLFLGDDEGTISTIELDLIGLGGPEGDITPVELASVGHPVDHLLVTDEGTVLAASDADLTVIDGSSGEILGRTEFTGIADLSTAGAGPVVQGDPAAIPEPAAVAEVLAELLGGDALDYESRIANAATGTTVLFGSPGREERRTEIEAAIADGRLPGIEIVDRPRAAVATSEGVSFIDPSNGATSSTIAIDGGAHGMALVTGIDDTKLYVSTGSVEDPGYHVLLVSGNDAAEGPTDKGGHPLPGLGSLVAYDAASQQVHILGRPPVDGGVDRYGPDRWTVYVIEPHADAVYADAVLPVGFQPVALAMDAEPEYMTDDRQQLLVFDAGGTAASIDVGSHAFAWRLPGVIAGVLMAACLYILTRILFQRRTVALAVGGLALVEGMFFVQSRIGMNDAYVGLFILAAYTVFAAIWTGWWRGRAAFWVGMPIIGLLLGLALASKWVAAYAIGALVLLLLVRSALGRVLAILGLIAMTGVLGYLAMAGPGYGNLPFLVIMIGLTLLAVVVAIFHPIAWTDDEMWLALIAPSAVGAVLFFGALAMGKLDQAVVIGPISVTPLLAAIASALASVVVYAAFRVGGMLGYGPLRRPAASRRSATPPRPARSGPDRLAAARLVARPTDRLDRRLPHRDPAGGYIVSYLPWTAIENHRLWDGFPAAHSGQTLLELTRSMYDYHNGLTSAHPASSPWWAFPFDLKPVWFYQEGFAGGTSAAIYDSGNLVIWWLGIVGLVFVSVMAFWRRSPALALIAIGFAAQWVPWARIDRAAFQYHYYTALPFVILALAYLVAELWHGASRRTWLWVRIAAAVAIVAPAAMWLFSRPLCALVGVSIANPSSAACPAVIPDVVLTLPHRCPAGGGRGRGRRAVARDGWSPARRGGRGRGTQPDDVGCRAGRRCDRARLRRGVVGARHADRDVARDPGRADRAGRDRAAPLPRGPGPGRPRCASVRRRAGNRGRGVVRRLVSESRGSAAAVDRGERVPGLPAHLPVRVPVPGEHRCTAARTAAQPDPAGVDRGDRSDLPGRRLLGLRLAARARRVACERGLGQGRLGRLDRRVDGRGSQQRPRAERRGRLRDLGAEPFRQRAGRREPTDHEAVVVVDLGGHPRPGELFGTGLTRGAHLLAEGRIAQQPIDREGELARLARRDEQALPAAPDHALVAVDVGRDDRRPGRHRLEQYDPERLAARGR